MQNQTPDLTSQVASALGIAETPTPEVATEPQTPDVVPTVVENPEQAPQQPETPAPDTEKQYNKTNERTNFNLKRNLSI